MLRKEILQQKSPLFPCYLCRDGVEGKEAVTLGGVREVAGLGGNLSGDVGTVEERRRGFDKEESAGSTGLEIDAMRFEIFVVGIVGLGETVFEEDNKREACFAERAGDRFLAFGDSGGDIDSAVGGFGEALIAEGDDVGRREAAGTLEDRPLWVVGEEDIAERSTGNSADEGLAMEAEEVGVGALEREAAGVVEDVVFHVSELAFVGQHAVVILGGKKDVSRGDIREHWTGGSISRRNIAEHWTGGCEGVIMVGALEFEPADIGTEMLG